MKTILIVEDDPIAALDETAVLSHYGYGVIAAKSGEEAVDLCRRVDEIDMVLMDIDLGEGMDGPEAAQAILAEREIPIVFLTSHAERGMVEKVRGITRYGYVIKNSGDFVLISSIEMAFELFDAHRRVNAESARSAAILRSLPDLLFVIGRDGTYREVYVPDNSVLPMPVEEIIGKNLRDMFGVEEAERHLAVYEACFATGETRSLEYEIQLRDGLRSYEAHITVYDRASVLAIARDITERRRADEMLRESEARYRQLFHNAPAGIYEVDFATQRFTKVNSLICEYTGYSEAELLSMNPLDILTDESKAHFIGRVGKMLAGQPVPSETEYCIREKNGNTRWVVLNNEFFYRDGVITSAAVVAHDITERRLMEESIRQLLAEKELLLQEIHHRVKNNMNTVKSLLSMQARAMKIPEASQVLSDAAGRIQSMAVLYDKLYRSENFRELNMRLFLTPLIGEILEVLPGAASIAADIHVDDTVVSSKALLPVGIILNELITNSVRYAFPGGGDGTIAISVSGSNGGLTLIYSDNGVGLPESITPDNSTGFGMRLVGMMVKQMQGSIAIERGSGTRFVIRAGL
jgi:PAS domain S-box-containing protein